MRQKNWVSQLPYQFLLVCQSYLSGGVHIFWLSFSDMLVILHILLILRIPCNSSYLFPSSASAVIWPFWALPTRDSNIPIVFLEYLSLLPLSDSLFIDLLGMEFGFTFANGSTVWHSAETNFCARCILNVQSYEALSNLCHQQYCHPRCVNAKHNAKL